MILQFPSNEVAAITLPVGSKLTLKIELSNVTLTLTEFQSIPCIAASSQATNIHLEEVPATNFYPFLAHLISMIESFSSKLTN